MIWQVERGIGEDRALLVDGVVARAAMVRWPGEWHAGQSVRAKLLSHRTGSPRGVAMTDSGEELLVDRLPKGASEGAMLDLVITRAALAERGRFKRPQARPCPLHSIDDPFAHGATVRRFPEGMWDEIWHAAWDRTIAFAGGSLLIDITPGMTVIDIDGNLAPRDLALAAVPVLAAAIRQFGIGGSIAIDFPTLAAKADRQAVDTALGVALADWAHERTAMNGFGLVQIVARLDGPSLVHRLALHRAGAAARFLLRQAEGLDGAGAALLRAHPAVLAAIPGEWLDELAQRTGRAVLTEAVPTLAIGAGHAQIVAR